jgi:hypothetical protein
MITTLIGLLACGSLVWLARRAVGLSLPGASYHPRCHHCGLAVGEQNPGTRPLGWVVVGCATCDP